MQHYRSIEEVTLQNSWLTIGVFDGIHRGHQEIIRKLTAGAHASNAPAVLLTFDPHPATVLGGHNIRCLTTPDERAELLADLGVDAVITQRFTGDLAAVGTSQPATVVDWLGLRTRPRTRRQRGATR
jgi:riboflavin kinase/FMN adenylyltransferase